VTVSECSDCMAVVPIRTVSLIRSVSVSTVWQSVALQLFSDAILTRFAAKTITALVYSIQNSTHTCRQTDRETSYSTD